MSVKKLIKVNVGDLLIGNNNISYMVIWGRSSGEYGLLNLISKVIIGFYSLDEMQNLLQHLYIADGVQNTFNDGDKRVYIIKHISNFPLTNFVETIAKYKDSVNNHLHELVNIAKLLAQKNHDYGDSYSMLRKEYGYLAFLVRLSDKINRLKTLTKIYEYEVKDEGYLDTIRDVIGYSLLELKYMQSVSYEPPVFYSYTSNDVKGDIDE